MLLRTVVGNVQGSICNLRETLLKIKEIFQAIKTSSKFMVSIFALVPQVLQILDFRIPRTE